VRLATFLPLAAWPPFAPLVTAAVCANRVDPHAHCGERPAPYPAPATARAL
jgi:hypothetical protein